MVAAAAGTAGSQQKHWKVIKHVIVQNRQYISISLQIKKEMLGEMEQVLSVVQQIGNVCFAPGLFHNDKPFNF